MGRPVILGNGALTVGLNEHGLVHDFYYPYVGLENLTTARSIPHKMGVWADGVFSWFDDEAAWQTTVTIELDALVAQVSRVSSTLGLQIDTREFVDVEYNAFCRQVHIRNTTEQTRDVRLFQHQVFEISRGGRADTALFVPEAGSYI
jgi:GH15 family glucan-1,4-alpha-glucosidase